MPSSRPGWSRSESPWPGSCPSPRSRCKLYRRGVGRSGGRPGALPVDIGIGPQAVGEEIPEQDNDDGRRQSQVAAQGCRRHVRYRAQTSLQQERGQGSAGSDQQGEQRRADGHPNDAAQGELAGLPAHGLSPRVGIGPIAVPNEVAGDGCQEGTYRRRYSGPTQRTAQDVEGAEINNGAEGPNDAEFQEARELGSGEARRRHDDFRKSSIVRARPASRSMVGAQPSSRRARLISGWRRSGSEASRRSGWKTIQ